jgi:hypothetical protein
MTDERIGAEDSPKLTPRLTAEQAAKIRTKASRLLEIHELAREALFATADYARKHRQGDRPDDIENTAASRIFLAYEDLIQFARDGASNTEIVRALGMHIMRLELLIARFEAGLSAEPTPVDEKR